MARIGPNAITRLAEASEDMLGLPACERLFQQAGLSAYRSHPPEAMVEEAEVVALHKALSSLHPAQATRVAADAGRRTALYLLAHRIPRPAQRILRLLPPGLAARALIMAIGKHAWTFAGSGDFRARAGKGMEITIEGGPFAAHCAGDSLLAFYETVFETLFRTLVSDRTQVIAAGVEGTICRFDLVWTKCTAPALQRTGPAHG